MIIRATYTHYVSRERGREREKERATTCTVLYCNLTKRGAYCMCMYTEGERERCRGERGREGTYCTPVCASTI